MAVERHISRQFTQQGQDGPERHLLGVKRLQQSLQRQVDTLRGLDNVKFAAFDRERKVSLVHDYVFNPGARPAMCRLVSDGRNCSSNPSTIATAAARAALLSPP